MRLVRSGYQTAVLAELSKLVITVERSPELARQAKDRLDVLGYKNIIAEIAEPEIGAGPQRPMRHTVTASPVYSGKLLAQLVGGRMVIPVGSL